MPLNILPIDTQVLSAEQVTDLENKSAEAAERIARIVLALEKKGKFSKIDEFQHELQTLALSFRNKLTATQSPAPSKFATRINQASLFSTIVAFVALIIDLSLRGYALYNEGQALKLESENSTDIRKIGEYKQTALDFNGYAFVPEAVLIAIVTYFTTYALPLGEYQSQGSDSANANQAPYQDRYQEAWYKFIVKLQALIDRYQSVAEVSVLETSPEELNQRVEDTLSHQDPIQNVGELTGEAQSSAQHRQRQPVVSPSIAVPTASADPDASNPVSGSDQADDIALIRPSNTHYCLLEAYASDGSLESEHRKFRLEKLEVLLVQSIRSFVALKKEAFLEGRHSSGRQMLNDPWLVKNINLKHGHLQEIRTRVEQSLYALQQQLSQGRGSSVLLGRNSSSDSPQASVHRGVSHPMSGSSSGSHQHQVVVVGTSEANGIEQQAAAALLLPGAPPPPTLPPLAHSSPSSDGSSSASAATKPAAAAARRESSIPDRLDT